MGAAIEESLTVLLQEIPEHETAFIALVPRNDPPQFDSKYCDPISSFICSSAFFEGFLISESTAGPRRSVSPHAVDRTG